MSRFLIVAAAALATASLFGAAALPAQAHTIRTISQTDDGKPILLGSMTVSATALPR